MLILPVKRLNVKVVYFKVLIGAILTRKAGEEAEVTTRVVDELSNKRAGQIKGLKIRLNNRSYLTNL